MEKMIKRTDHTENAGAREIPREQMKMEVIMWRNIR